VRRRRASGASLVLLAGLSACADGGSPAGDGGVSVQDSAGIRVVDLVPAELPERSLAADPTWSFASITTSAGSHELSGVRVRPLAAGRLAIAEGSTRSLWLGEPAGSSWVGVAGRGDGPRELQRVSGMSLDADGSVWIQDGARLRALQFSPEGDFLGSLDFGEVGWRGPNWSVRSGAHYFLGSGGGAGPSDRGVFRTEAPLVRLDASGAADTLGSIPASEWYTTDRIAGGPFVSPRSEGAGALEGHWVGDQAESRIARWTRGPTPAVIVRWPHVDRPMEALGDSMRRLVVANAAPEQMTGEIRATIEGIPVSESPPQFIGLVPRGDGGVMVGPFWARAPVPQQRPAGDWFGVTAAGDPLARIRLPQGFEPHWFEVDHVIGVMTDELGRESVQRWEIVN